MIYKHFVHISILLMNDDQKIDLTWSNLEQAVKNRDYERVRKFGIILGKLYAKRFRKAEDLPVIQM